MQKIIETNQNELFLGYMKKMELIRKDIIELKEKADVERLKIKRDEKIQSLEKQRDWFRDEALA